MIWSTFFILAPGERGGEQKGAGGFSVLISCIVSTNTCHNARSGPCAAVPCSPVAAAAGEASSSCGSNTVSDPPSVGHATDPGKGNSASFWAKLKFARRGGAGDTTVPS